jgi:hypothetical protein
MKTDKPPSCSVLKLRPSQMRPRDIVLGHNVDSVSDYGHEQKLVRFGDSGITLWSRETYEVHRLNANKP